MGIGNDDEARDIIANARELITPHGDWKPP